MNGLAPLVDGCELAPVLAPDLAPDLAPVLAGGGCDLGAGWDLAGGGCDLAGRCCDLAGVGCCCDLAGVGSCCDLLVLQKGVRLVLVDNIKILTNALVNK